MLAVPDSRACSFARSVLTDRTNPPNHPINQACAITRWVNPRLQPRYRWVEGGLISLKLLNLLRNGLTRGVPPLWYTRTHPWQFDPRHPRAEVPRAGRGTREPARKWPSTKVSALQRQCGVERSDEPAIL